MLTRTSWPRKAFAVAAALVLVGVGNAFGFALIAPTIALPIWPSAKGLGLVALQTATATGAGPRQLDRARADALRALRTEPGNVAATKTLGAIADARGDKAGALRWFRYTAALTRRDLITNIWLIEQAVDTGNIPDALRYYDVALRTSRDAPAMLYPVLVRAADNPAIRTPLGHMLAARPPWYMGFAAALVTRSGDPAVAIPDLIAAIRLDASKPLNKELLEGALARLVAVSANRQAERLYFAALNVPARSDPAANLVHNASFARDGQILPFDWAFTDRPEIAPLIRPADRGGRVLTWNSDAEWEGNVATQTILASPGRYLLRVRAGAFAPSSGDNMRIRVFCTDPGKPHPVVGELPISATGETGRRFIGIITIPAKDCAAQSLSLAIRNDNQPGGGMPWVTDIGLFRLGRRS